MSFERRSFPGAAPNTTLDGAINNSVTAFTVQAGTGSGYPDGTAGKFFVVLDYDVASTEKILVTSRTGDTFSGCTRGADGTTPIAHADGAKVRACITATDADEANDVASQVLGQITAIGGLLTGSSAHELVETLPGADDEVWVSDSSQPGGGKFTSALTGIALDETSTVEGITGAQIAADHASVAEAQAAWTSWTPVIVGNVSNPTLSTHTCAYLLVGKTLHMRFRVGLSAVGSGGYSVTLPSGLTAKDTGGFAAMLLPVSGSPFVEIMQTTFVVGLTTLRFFLSSGTQYGSSVAANGDIVEFTATIEVA